MKSEVIPIIEASYTFCDSESILDSASKTHETAPGNFRVVLRLEFDAVRAEQLNLDRQTGTS